MALLAIHAYYQLLVAYSGIGEVVDLRALLQHERASLPRVLLCKPKNVGLCEPSNGSSSAGRGRTHQVQSACHTSAHAALVLTAHLQHCRCWLALYRWRGGHHQQLAGEGSGCRRLQRSCRLARIGRAGRGHACWVAAQGLAAAGAALDTHGVASAGTRQQCLRAARMLSCAPHPRTACCALCVCVCFEMTQGLSLVALAGDPSPWRLPAAALDPLVKLLGDLVEGEGCCCCAVVPCSV